VGAGRVELGAGGRPSSPRACDARCSTAELGQFLFEISSGPEQQTTQAFAPHVRNRLDLPDVEDPQVRLPLMKPVQRIMVRTEVGGQGLAARRAIQHPAQRNPVHDAKMHAETHNAPWPVIYHDELVRVKHDEAYGVFSRDSRSTYSASCLLRNRFSVAS